MIRKATLEDLPVIGRLRYQMFVDIGTSSLFVDDFIERTVAAYAKEYEDRVCVHFVEEDNGVIIGCAGGRISRNEFFRCPIQGYIMDVYVVPDHRGKGIARRLTEKVIEWNRNCGAETIKLHAALAAVPIYERLGFKNSREMSLVVSKDNLQQCESTE